jgi:hypothetical protein
LVIQALVYPLFNIFLGLYFTIPKRVQKGPKETKGKIKGVAEIRNYELKNLKIRLLDSLYTPTLNLLTKAESSLLADLTVMKKLPDTVNLQGDGEWKELKEQILEACGE